MNNTEVMPDTRVFLLRCNDKCSSVTRRAKEQLRRLCDGVCVCVCVWRGGNTCVTGNLSLSKECDSDPGMKVSVLVCASVLSACTGAGAQITIMTDLSYLFRGSSLM